MYVLNEITHFLLHFNYIARGKESSLKKHPDSTNNLN